MSMMRYLHDIFLPQIEPKGLQFRTYISGVPLSKSETNQLCNIPRLIGDEKRIKQIVMHLLRNSTKFTNTGFVEVRVEYNFSKSILSLSVQDSGAGIDPDDLPNLFSRFGKL